MTFQRVRSWHYLLLALFSLAIVALPLSPASADLSRTFYTDDLSPYQLTNLTADDERALGEAIDAYLKQNGLKLYDKEPTVVAYIDRVGQRLVVASPTQAMFTFQVVEDDNPNAFATLGGFIYINTGLLRQIRNEAELAGVLAHEIGHIQQQDGLNQLWLQLTVHQLAGLEQGLQQRLIAWGGTLRSLANSHEDEYSADALALRLLGQAGYAQIGLLSLLQRLISEPTGPTNPSMISTHPSPQRRLAHLQGLWETELTATATDGQTEPPYQTNIAPINR